MTEARRSSRAELKTPNLPAWIVDSSGAITAEYASFASGSALALLHTVLDDITLNVPAKLLNQSLGLNAAEHCLRLARTRSSKQTC